MSNEKYQKNDIFSYVEVFDRLSKEIGIKNQSEIAKLVGVKQTAVSARKKQDIWPEEWAYRIGKKFNLLTEWILTGEGPKSLDELKQSFSDQEIITDISEWFEEIVSKNPRKKDWFIVSFYDAFPSFEKWKEKQNEDQDSTFSQKKKIA